MIHKYFNFVLFSAFISFFFVFSSSCDEGPTEPEPEPGRRDYVWTVDTLNAPNDTYYRIWGSSSEDIWLVSSGSWEKSIAHYNGEKWSYYGVTGMNTPYSVYGFSSNDVYIGTAGGGIWHYDGTNWTKFTELTKDGQSNIVFDRMWGKASNDLYALGAYPDEYGYNNSVISHYINGKWEMFNTDQLYGIVVRLYINNIDNKTYIYVNGGRNYTDSTHIYEYVNQEYLRLYSNTWTKGLQADISLLSEEVFFILGNRIATRTNNKFNTVVEVDNPNFYQRIWGRNEKDIFLLMTDGLVHYNGNNMEYLFYFNKPNAKPWTQIFGAVLLDKEVFF